MFTKLFSPWWLLPIVLLALPNCALDVNGISGGPVECQPGDVECYQPVFQPGENPAAAIMCDIPKPLEANDDGCATPAEAADPGNLSLTEAATALVDGAFKSYALDFSDDAKKQCGGLPKKINFFGDFPDGKRVCINCGTQMPNPYATMEKACIAKCTDLVNTEGPIPAEGAAAFCEANARLATNHQETCYDGACTLGGNPDLSWVDPRRTPEPVKWVDHIGTQDGGTNSLERFAPTTGTTTADFNAGAASAQIITRGDAWIEFSAFDSTNTAHVLGVRESVDASNGKCFSASFCPDTDPSLDNIGFAISLNTGGQVFVFEIINGVLTAQGPFGTYTTGERYRVRVTDDHDGKATISYSRIVAGVDTKFHETTLAHPQYPLRVDTSFREQNALISDVTIVRIK